MGKTTFFRFFTLLVLCAAAKVFAQDSQFEQYKQVPGGSEVRHEMGEFVDSVKQAMQEVQGARSKKEVLDLGQSLHMLEHKFAGLKAAIAHEMGTRLPHAASHTETSKELVSTSARLLEDVAGYRGDMQRLLVNMREIDDAIRTIRDGMNIFDQEVQEMNRLLADLHVRTINVHETHTGVRSAIRDATEEHSLTSRTSSGSARWVYIVIVIEIAAVAAFYYRKSASTTKHYGKFG